ncbi:MAG: hypothetical protein ABUL77_05365 [Bacteroidota bacterium]
MRVIVILLVGLAAPGCFTKSGACTLIGCTDQATIGIQKENGGPVTVALALDIDGRAVTCPAPALNGFASCDTQVTVASREVQTCVEETTATAKVLRCSGSGRFEQVVTINGTPKVVRITASDAGGVVGERSFQPLYATLRPNGPDCDPVCRQWGADWVLP